MIVAPGYKPLTADHRVIRRNGVVMVVKRKRT